MNGKKVCYFHGGASSSTHGGYCNNPFGDKIKELDQYIESPLKVLEDQLKLTLGQLRNLIAYQEKQILEKETEARTRLLGLDLQEISEGGEDYKARYANTDYTGMINSKIRLIKELSSQIYTMKKEMGLNSATDRIVFDINLTGIEGVHQG